ncbi:hypothetical protein Q9966_011236 [Columba livia]|nr:hypothetical protein Q9966_011236 [Columba livia]
MATAAPWQRVGGGGRGRGGGGRRQPGGGRAGTARSPAWLSLGRNREGAVVVGRRRGEDERLGTLGLPEAQNCTKASGIVDVQQRPSGSCQLLQELIQPLVQPKPIVGRRVKGKQGRWFSA